MLEVREGVAHITYDADVTGQLCSQEFTVPGGQTVRIRARLRGDPTLRDASGLHLHLAGGQGDLSVARQRLEPGDQGWEDLDFRATAPPAADRARLCFDFQIPKVKVDGHWTVPPGGGAAGGVWVERVEGESVRTSSSAEKLPLQRIILVTVEALRRDHLELYGYGRSTSPNLERLASTGVRFDRHYATAPYTHPSLASLLSSAFPTALGFADNLAGPSDLTHTAADVFAGAGYVTAAFNAQYVLSNRYGFSRGFHYYRNWPNDTPSATVNDELLPWLAAHAADNVFVWVHYFDPHGPYRPPASFRAPFVADALFAGDPTRLTTSLTAVEGMPQIPGYLFDRNQYERRHYVAGYDGDIAWWDSELGRLTRFISESGWDADTLMMVTADHGESMTDHRRFFCHGSLYEHDVHVPLVIAAPGRVPAGGVFSGLSSHLDLVPTLLDYAGIPANDRLSGHGLRRLIDGEEESANAAFVAAVVGKGAELRYAVVGEGPVKLILGAGLQVEEAYNLESDPDELHNLAVPASHAIVAMARKFREWLPTGWAPPATPPAPSSAEDLEMLRAMGYQD